LPAAPSPARRDKAGVARHGGARRGKAGISIKRQAVSRSNHRNQWSKPKWQQNKQQ
jgi:hypothetical protein